MDVFVLPQDLQATALAEPEQGMGYQVTSVTFGRFDRQQGLLLSGAFFIPEQLAKFAAADIRSDERRVYVDLSAPNIIDPESAGTAKKASIFLHPPTKQLLSRTASPQPPFLAKTTAGEMFYRLSAFMNDRRVLPDKSLAAQTYTTTDTDIKVVPSGLAAVGRYALPSPLPAVHVFMIKPAAGTPVAYGTVRPNYGMAGGGVEAYFPSGTGPGSVFYMPALPMK